MDHHDENPAPQERRQVGKGANAETSLRVLKPSARALIPAAILCLAWAVIVTRLLSLFEPQVIWVARWVAQFMGDAFPYDTWYLWLLGILLGPSVLSLLYRLLELKTTTYEFTSQRLRYTRGILNRQRDQIELVRVRDLTAYRSLLQRILGLGTLYMETVDRTHPRFTLEAQRDVYGLKDWVHELNIQERARLGYREFEGTQGVE